MQASWRGGLEAWLRLTTGRGHDAAQLGSVMGQTFVGEMVDGEFLVVTLCAGYSCEGDGPRGVEAVNIHLLVAPSALKRAGIVSHEQPSLRAGREAAAGIGLGREAMACGQPCIWPVRS